MRTSPSYGYSRGIIVVGIVIFVVILLCPITVVSQSNVPVLHGFVQDSQGRAVSGATVTIAGTGISGITNEKGEFTIHPSTQVKEKVTVTAPGFFPQTLTIDFSKTSELNLTLARTVLVEEQISVDASRLQLPLAETPAATSIIGPEVLQALPRSVGAEEVLAATPGVKVDNQANQERVHISIRGQGILTEHGIRGIEVLLDGVPLNDPTGFAPDLFDVDWGAVSEVDVVRGPVAFLYGGGSSGGVINISTRTAGADPRGEFSALGGSNGLYKARTEFSQRFGDTSFFLSAARAAGDGYRVHTRFYGNNLFGKVSFKIGRSLQLNLIGYGTGYFNQNPEGLNLEQVQQDPRQPNPDALTYNEYQKTRRGTGALTGNWAISENQHLSFSSYERYTHYDESVPSSVDHQDMGSPGGSAQYSADLGSGAVRHHLSVGFDLDGQMIDEFRHPNLGGGVQNSDLLANQHLSERRSAGFITERIVLGQKWAILGSVRGDHISNGLTDYLKADGLDLSGERTFNRVTGRAGVTFNPRKDTGLYASWGQGFLPPATEELDSNPDAFGGFNTHLVPATSWGVEGGFRGSVHDRLFYDAAVFHLNTTNDFERYRIVSRPLETFYGNAGETSRYGLETEMRWLTNHRLTLSVSYTYSHFVYTAYASQVYPGNLTGNWLPNSPNHQLYFDAIVNLPKGFLVSVGTQAYSRAFIDPTNQSYVDGYGLLNARVARQWQCGKLNCTAYVYGRNLTATNYIAFTEPDPDGNSYQPGPRREVFAGVRISF